MTSFLAMKSTKEAINHEEQTTVSATGRPVRRTAGKRSLGPEFVSSSDVIRDDIGDLIEEKMDQIATYKSKSKKEFYKKCLKRGRSPSPPPYNPVEIPSEQAMELLVKPVFHPATESRPITLQINIPQGFAGPVTINIDPSTITQLSTPSPTSHYLVDHPLTKRACSEKSTKTQIPIPVSSSPKPTVRIARYMRKHGKAPAGFCDLPPELRNLIYREIFVAKAPFCFSSSRINCCHSAAFLRTCKMVHDEGVGILYQENSFKFERIKLSRNPFWSCENKEVGYLDFRQFITMIGFTGRSNLRNISICFEDAQRSGHPSYTEGRFTGDGNLIATLKLIASECSLYRIKLNIIGRYKLTSYEVRFIERMCNIQADDVVICRTCKIEEAVKRILYNEMTRPDNEKLYPERRALELIRKKKNTNKKNLPVLHNHDSDYEWW